ncbi:hypothetical protein ABT352_33430 [Streptosporangium sp. NPDC000563]
MWIFVFVTGAGAITFVALIWIRMIRDAPTEKSAIHDAFASTTFELEP